MPDRRVYPRPPIVEAVIELRFAGELEVDGLYDAIKGEVGDDYTGEEVQKNMVQVDTRVSGDTISTTSTKAPHVRFIRSQDRLRLVGIGKGVLSVHVLAPYPGWENFLEQAANAITAVPRTVQKGGLASVAVRYIDRITIPEENDGLIELGSYFTMIPDLPPSSPGPLVAFNFVTHSFDPETRTNAILTLANIEQGVLYDLHIVREMDETPIEFGLWRGILEELHTRQRDMFEESITDKARELFS